MSHRSFSFYIILYKH